jgi:hypothetical protein
MSGRGRLLLVAASGLLCATLCRAAPDFAGARASDDARYATDRVVAAADNQGLPFAIVDKKDARIYVFEPSGRLIGASAVLLGSAPGDDAAADIANRSPGSGLAPVERTTPAGRFATTPGHNDKGEAIVWVDYDAALAIHRLRPAPAQERRVERLASAASDDHRISLGCIVVPVDFYESVIGPSLGSRRGVVYVLPESRSVRALFDAVELSLRTD